jgi:pentatricopeptide repeat protein
MQRAGVEPDRFTFPFILKACAGLVVIEQGRRIHDYILRYGFESDAFVGSALIDMYAKCGEVELARQVFDRMSQRDVVSWTSMIGGYAQKGHADEALELFQQMQQTGMKPNLVTIVTL